MGAKSSKLSPETISHLAQNTRFSSKDLQQWHRGFMKDCPSGQLAKKDFQAIYKQYFPFGDASKYAGFVFSLMDTENKGIVSFTDFMLALDVSSKGSIDEKLEWAFRMYDLDEGLRCLIKDGFISPAEMLCIVDSIYRMIGSTDSMPDDESTPEARVEKVFGLMDIDGDGLISKQEFMQGSRDDPRITESLNLYSAIM